MKTENVKLVSITVECPECNNQINLSPEYHAICTCGAKFTRCIDHTFVSDYYSNNFGMPAVIKSTFEIGCVLPNHSKSD